MLIIPPNFFLVITLSINASTVPKPGVKLPLYEPVILTNVLYPGISPKIATSALVIDPSLFTQTVNTSTGAVKVYPELDNVVFETSLAIRFPDDDILLMYISKGPVFGEAPFSNKTTNDDPDVYDNLLYFEYKYYLLNIL